MNITMNDENITSIAQLRSFLKEVEQGVSFSIENIGNKNKQEMYDWVGTIITRFRYFSLRKKEKNIVLDYIKKITRRSRPQIKRLVQRKKKFGKIRLSVVKKNTFPVLYNTSDVARLIETDNAHGRLSGPATKRILQREYLIFGKLEYEKIYHISVPHIYNIRKKSRQYKSNILFIAKTQSVNRNIGERRKPRPLGKPGYLRVDSVHQGDLGEEKGVYYVNMVDEVTQWEVVGCVRGISEEFLTPLLEELLLRFPFLILNFHSDNGSEYINYQVAKILEKMRIDQTKSMARRSTNNALVEGKNGAIIRKHMGHSYIEKKNARNINIFFQEHMDEYLNFHRPCGFATDYTNEKGKITKKYETYMTPYEKLISISNFQQYLKPDVSASFLSDFSKRQSDNESAQKMQFAKSKLFKNFTV
jgi:transposase InsO family protein